MRISSSKPYDYKKILNNVLPSDIKVHEVRPVPVWFDARFQCTARTYRYIFEIGDLDLVKMDKAAKSFVGTHNFLNFCRVDPKNPKQTTIAETVVLGMAYAQIKGQAFLWHQVRCMMGALFRVGAGKQSPEVISEWLDTSKTETKPLYTMAEPDGLILWECTYPKLPDIDGTISIPLEDKIFSPLRREVALHLTVLDNLGRSPTTDIFN